MWFVSATSAYCSQQRTGLTWAAVIWPDGGLLCGGLALFAVGWLSFSVCPSMVSKKLESFSSSSSCWCCLVETVAESSFLAKFGKKMSHYIISPLGKYGGVMNTLERKEFGGVWFCSFLLQTAAGAEQLQLQEVSVNVFDLCRFLQNLGAGGWKLRVQREKTELHANTLQGFWGKPKKTCLKKGFPSIRRDKAVSVFLSPHESLLHLLRKQEMGCSPLAQAQSDSFQSFQRSVWKVGHPGWLSSWLLLSFISAAASTGSRWKLPTLLIFTEKA